MTLSPMMQQYQEARRACPEALLLFRMGDFYELFFEDAKTAARVLGLTLTSRDKGENPVPMAGFPYHQLETYLARLISAGHRAAICDQVEDPKKAKGIVKRDVTRIVSRGTLTDDALLDPRTSNFLASVVLGETTGVAWVDVSTGKFLATTVPAARLADELARIDPVECLISDSGDELPEGFAERMAITTRPAWSFGLSVANESLSKQFGAHSLEGFGFELERDSAAIRAAGGILDYLAETQRTSLAHLDSLTPHRPGSALEIDEASRRSLELVRTIRDGSREGSLLGAIDRTITPMGSRLLAEWLAGPLTSIDTINDRLDAVAELVATPPLGADIRATLREVYDMQRLVARATTGRASPRDLSCVTRTLRKLPSIKAKLSERASGLINRLEGDIDLCPELRKELDAGLVDDCPLTTRDGGFIRPGYRPALDELRELASGGKRWIAQYQAEESTKHGIPNVKVGYNKVFGYYLEITHTHSTKIPPHYIRKQTVKNAERYVTPELKEYEEKVLSAEERSKELEGDLFITLRDLVAASGKTLQRTAEALATLDVLAGLAELARERSYCRPQMVEEPTLSLIDARHPVVDAIAPLGTFVPNDATINETDGMLLLITGPNMAGKSTYIRQTALLVLLAQIGSFVPAKSATVGIADRIFARVGASDELARGQSTFMVEMTETARILNTATPRSLVILDEIGRGTSTYDGLSLAWAIVEHLHDQVGCRTMFATHYHELTELASMLPRVANYNVAVREWEEQVVFLHRIERGAADKSYGIHVARLAGIPKSVNSRAKEILSRLEDEHQSAGSNQKAARAAVRRGQLQLTLFEPPEHPLVEQLRALDLAQTTPMAALELLHRWKGEVDDGK